MREKEREEKRRRGRERKGKRMREKERKGVKIVARERIDKLEWSWKRGQKRREKRVKIDKSVNNN